MSDNDRLAARNRALFDDARVLAVNLMSSPAAGKTSLLEATIRALRGRLSVAVIEGSIETANDAVCIRSSGAPVVRVPTGGAGQSNADIVSAVLHALDLRSVDVLFFENVGDDVCPALGQHRDVAVLPVTDGDDTPGKIPALFGAADLVAVTKIDLMAEAGDFELATARRHLRGLGNAAPLIELSSRSGQGMDAWIGWVVCEVVAGRFFPACHHPRGTRRSAGFGPASEPWRWVPRTHSGSV